MFTYPYWSMLPMLYMLLAAWLVLLVVSAATSDLYHRYQTRHLLQATTLTGGRHQPRSF